MYFGGGVVCKKRIFGFESGWDSEKGGGGDETNFPLAYQLNEHQFLQRLQLQRAPYRTLSRCTNDRLEKLFSLTPFLQRSPNQTAGVVINEIIVVREIGAEDERDSGDGCVEEGESESVVFASDDGGEEEWVKRG